MPATVKAKTPGLPSFLQSLKNKPVDTSIENLISLLKRREIRNSRPCAIATAHLLRSVVAQTRVTDLRQLIDRVSFIGKRLTDAQPKEIAVGNVVRRVLGAIREELDEDRNDDGSAFSETSYDSSPTTPREAPSPKPEIGSPLRQVQDSQSSSDFTYSMESSMRPSMIGSHPSITGGPLVTSMFNLLSTPFSQGASPIGTPGNQSPAMRGSPKPHATPLSSVHTAFKELKADVIAAIEEIIDELDVVDETIAAYAPEHIHSNEIVLVTGSSTTVQKFLLRAAAKRKFTVIHAESYPNNHEETHAVVAGKLTSPEQDEDDSSPQTFTKPLTEVGINVVLIQDAAVFALMSRVNKVILGTHVVLANGGLVAAAGTKMIAQAARAHSTPVVVVSGVYKLSPIYPFDFDALIEYGDAGAVICYDNGDFVGKVDIENPLYDYVPPELVDLYITNLGGHAPSYLYRIVSDHYRQEDTNLAVE